MEGEYLHISASGTLRIADSREIAFSLDLSFTHLSLTAEASQAEDPLVINLDGTPAKLSDITMRLDLDGDGVTEEIPFVIAGKAFLVYDKNGDGVVNDGRELFGPATGQGFSELAALDDDQNGRIDSGDNAFSSLRLWQLASEGYFTLTPLLAAGVDALGLQAGETPILLTDSAGQPTGQIARTGFFYTHDGAAGTVQQVNLFI